MEPAMTAAVPEATRRTAPVRRRPLIATAWLDACSPPCGSLTERREQEDEQPEYEEPEFTRPVASQPDTTHTSPRAPVGCFSASFRRVRPVRPTVVSHGNRRRCSA